MSKSCQKIVSCQKVVQKVVKKLLKSCQKVIKKLSKKWVIFLKRAGEEGEGNL
jgi:hypothetical protein